MIAKTIPIGQGKRERLITEFLAFSILVAAFIGFGILMPRTASAAAYYTVDSSLLIPKSVSASELDDFIRMNKPSSPLIGHSQMWINAQTKYGIDAVYLMAHAMLESAWGTSGYSLDRYNIYGYGAYDSNPDNAYWFSSYEQCVDQVAGWIFEDYLSPTGGYYHGPTLRGMNVSYATADHWSQSICSIMNEFYDLYPFVNQPPPDIFYSRGYTTDLYRIALQREPSYEEVGYWADLMVGNYLSRRLLAKTFIEGPEGNQLFVRNLIREALSREPGPGDDIATPANALQSGSTTERKLKATYYSEAEFFNLHGGNDSAWVVGLYQHILGRTPGTEEINYWVSLHNSGTSRYNLTYNFFLSSPEYYQKYFAAQFKTILGRDPDQGLIDQWSAAMGDSRYPLSERQLRRDLFSTDEFLHTSIVPFVQSLYVTVLQRSPGALDPAGVSYFRNLLAGGAPRGDVVGFFFGALEYSQNYVRQQYQAILGRDPDNSGLDYFAGRLSGGLSERVMQTELFGSQEYFEQTAHSSNDEYVKTLYTQIMGRAYDQAGVDYWTGQISNGSSRAAIAQAFMFSPEKNRVYVTNLYQTILGRPGTPSDGEVDYWAGFLNNGMLEKTLKQYFCSSDEYAFKHL